MAKSKAKPKGEYRPFIRIAEAGVVGANGKARMSIVFKGRSIAQPDHAMEFFVDQMFDAVRGSLGWSSRKAALKDFDAAIRLLTEFKNDIDGEEIEPPEIPKQ